jgi:hypothetical protein
VQENWGRYIAPENNDMMGHMMTYPVEVRNTGHIEIISRVEDIPDFPGACFAGKATNLPPVLTT